VSSPTNGGSQYAFVAVSVACGLIPTLSPSLFQYLPAWISPVIHTGVVLGSIVAFLLNPSFNGTTAQQLLLGPNNVRPEAVEREIFRVAVGPLPRFRHKVRRDRRLFFLSGISSFNPCCF
jgi:hypothetical protein